MQVLDTAKVLERLPEKPYAYEGLSVQGVSPVRLTPRPNESITVPEEVGRTIGLRNLARRFTESRIAIALAGLGLRPAALTVRGHVRATITFAELARVAASLPLTVELSSIPKPARPSEPPAVRPDVDVTLEVPGLGAIRLEGYETDEPFESNPEVKVDVSGYNEHVSNDKYLGLEIEL